MTENGVDQFAADLRALADFYEAHRRFPSRSSARSTPLSTPEPSWRTPHAPSARRRKGLVWMVLPAEAITPSLILDINVERAKVCTPASSELSSCQRKPSASRRFWSGTVAPC